MKENSKISTLEVFGAPLGNKYCQRNLNGPSGRLASLRSANCDLINFRFSGGFHDTLWILQCKIIFSNASHFMCLNLFFLSPKNASVCQHSYIFPEGFFGANVGVDRTFDFLEGFGGGLTWWSVQNLIFQKDFLEQISENYHKIRFFIRLLGG